MDRNDQKAIECLFERLAAAETRSPPRDAAAEYFIRQRIAEQPGAPYYMAQTILVQEQALEAAQARIEALEAAARRGGQSRGRPAEAPQRAGGSAGGAGPWQTQGGFLAGAAQTAMGVASGVLLGHALADMLGLGHPDPAQAGGPAPDEVSPAPGFDDTGGAQDDRFEDTGRDDGGFDDAGFEDGGVDDGGWGGGFDDDFGGGFDI